MSKLKLQYCTFNTILHHQPKTAASNILWNILLALYLQLFVQSAITWLHIFNNYSTLTHLFFTNLLLLVRYVPINRPTTDRPHILENFEWPYLGNGSSDTLHVWFQDRVFEVGGSNGPTSGWTKSKMAAGRRLRKFWMTISLEWVIRSTFMNYRAALEEYRRK